ncbi:MAG: serine/threonine protein phosphatase [Pseudoxanthomonas sp.]
MVEQMQLATRQRAWLKHYPEGGRAMSLGALKLLVNRLGIGPLRPPPHRGGDAARAIEARRLRELAAQHVNVPQVLGQGKRSLMLSDNGRSLNACLREASSDAARDALMRLAVQAIAEAHARGAYFGQPVPRNMTFDGTQIGFIDFEEDPLEVMTLAQAQARDWLMFGYGVARYYESRPDVLQKLMADAMAQQDARIREATHEATTRLQRLAGVARHFGRSARTLAQAILVIHGATSLGLLVVGVLMVDYFSDGDLDVLRILAG